MKKNGWVTDRFGNKYHYINGLIHNNEGPSVMLNNGAKFWYKNNLTHREDGAAKEYSDGDKAWYYDGRCLGTSWDGYSQEQFEGWKRFKAFI